MTTPTVTRELEKAHATGADVRSALQSASAWLSASAERINALNVFPVPDGDTGTNMSLTLQAALEGLQRLGDDALPGAPATQGRVEAAVLRLLRTAEAVRVA